MHRYDRIPPLAGLATYGEAARVGWSVNENVRRLLRLHWTERRLMSIMIAHLTAEPVWEVKCALALHQWQCAEHVDTLRRRVAEMRSPAPSLDTVPDDAASLDVFLDELLRSSDTDELLVGIYGVALPALAAAYAEHLDGSNPLVDQPTRRMVRAALAETEDAIAWGAEASAAAVDVRHTRAWREHLEAYLAAAGGIAGGERKNGGELPPRRDAKASVIDFQPRRDER